MSLADLLAKLADKQHAEGCDCDVRVEISRFMQEVSRSIPNSCTELARQAKELHDAEPQAECYLCGGIFPLAEAIIDLDGRKRHPCSTLPDAAVVATGHWTTEPPTAPGWYYVLNRTLYNPPQVARLMDGLVYLPNNQMPLDLEGCKSWALWWSIPLWLPEAPKEERDEAE